ncbi:MAG: M28 family peptidase [Proteobacteria bacterium]|nr:M28 family peptidase [Pseudomonadota bacterium]MCP4916049.1 M28 family peptidase [Pseudomonadota bacterium]
MIVPALPLFLACTGPESEPEPLVEIVPAEVLDGMDWERVRDLTEVLTDDATGGRVPGSPGHAAARDVLLGELADFESYLDDGYVHAYPSSPASDRWMVDVDGAIVPQVHDTGQNLIAMIPGTDPDHSSEVIVLMAHYDHLGVTEDGQVFNGAFDDAVGTVVVLEIGRALQQLQTDRSVMLLITDDEEGGLRGAENFLADQVVPYDEIVFAVSVDPMGRGVLPDAWPLALMGLERSPELLAGWKDLVPYAEMPVAFVHREIIPVFASDQDEFYRLDDPIPAVWFTSPGMAFYHTTGDDAETIDYRSVKVQAEWLLQVVTYFANDTKRFDDIGEPEIGPEHGADARPLVASVAQSEWLTDYEKSEVNGMLNELDAAIEADDIEVLGNSRAWFTNAILRLCFELPAEHPGDIPPPFPE